MKTCGDHGGKRKDGRPCNKSVVPGRPRCRLHGGNNPVGPANGRWTHGRYSQYMPTGLKAKYEEAEADPSLGEMRGELAILQALIAERIERLERSGISNEWWTRLRRHADDIVAANAVGDRDRVGVLLTGMIEEIRRGSTFAELCDEIGDMIERKSRVAAREWKRMVDLQQLMTVERAMALAEALIQSVVRNVEDVDAVRRISDDVGRLMGGPNRNGTTGSG